MTKVEIEMLETAALVGEMRVRAKSTAARSRAIVQASLELIEEAKRAKAERSAAASGSSSRSDLRLAAGKRRLKRIGIDLPYSRMISVSSPGRTC